MNASKKVIEKQAVKIKQILDGVEGEETIWKVDEVTKSGFTLVNFLTDEYLVFELVTKSKKRSIKL